MRILLVSLNRETEPFTAAPLGLALVAGSLIKAGHEVRALDLLFSTDVEGHIAEAIAGQTPELIGLSLRNIESSTEFLLPSYRQVIDHIKGLTRAPLVLGGPGFSIMPRQVMEYLGVGLGIAGEGEAAVVALADALARGKDPAGAPGVCMLKDGAFSYAPAKAIEDLSGARPAWGLFPVKGYDMVGVQSKRGCTFGCVYCTYPSLEGRRMRLASPADVVAGMREALDAGVESPFYFVDNVFNNPKTHAEAVCREIIGSGLKVSWGCLASPLGLDDGLLGLMKQAGCESVEIGADSLSDKALKGLGKNFNAESVKEAVRTCKRAGMMHMVFLILGGPGEDEGTLRETFAALEEIRPDKVFAVSGIRIYPGTPLARLAVKEGAIKGGDPLLEPAFYASRKLGDNLYRLCEAFFARHRDWIYYPAKGVAAPSQKKSDAPAAWDGPATELMDRLMLDVPFLLRPIAKKAVRRKSGALASERGLAAVTLMEVRDAFLSETPGPFQGPMRESLKKLGLLND